jgi:hypothetical protein
MTSREGKALVQLSTITMQQSRDLADWAHAHDIEYLDGAIRGILERVLEGNCLIIYSGSQHAFESHPSIFTAMGGKPQLTGERPGTAPALEMARMSCAFGVQLGYLRLSRGRTLSPSLSTENSRRSRTEPSAASRCLRRLVARLVALAVGCHKIRAMSLLQFLVLCERRAEVFMGSSREVLASVCSGRRRK